MFDPRYDHTMEYARTILKDMKTSKMKKQFDKASIILFANNFDLGDFTMNRNYWNGGIRKKRRKDGRLDVGESRKFHGW